MSTGTSLDLNRIKYIGIFLICTVAIIICAVYLKEKNPTPTQRWFPFSKHFSCYNGEYISPQDVFQLNSDKNNFAEATLVKAVMYKDLYACFDVTDHYFEKPGIGYYQVESI